MSTIEQIESAILTLPSADLRRLTAWLLDLHQNRWDDELEADIAGGRLDALAAEAVADYEAGRGPERSNAPHYAPFLALPRRLACGD